MDQIGWRRYTEGIISKEVLEIQAEYTAVGTGPIAIDNWAKGMTINLLEIIHSQWLYRKVVVRNVVRCLKVAQRKQKLQKETEQQIELG